MKDFAKIGISRHVFIDNDGLAKVNVMTELGAGLCNDSYDISAVVELSSTPEDVDPESTCVMLGDNVECSVFGSHVWKAMHNGTSYSTDDAFSAYAVYIGKGKEYDGKGF